MSDDRALTDDERFPLIDAAGRGWLDELRQHPSAPRYNMTCGDRLTSAGHERVRAYERAIFANDPSWSALEMPSWVTAFTARCLRDVPFYRRRGSTAGSFAELPPISRADLQREPWSFVPDSQPLDDMINYWTSGASGHSMDVLSHPDVASMRLPILRKALARHGLTLDGGARRTAIVFVCSQSTTFTYASLSSYLGGAAHVKVNLNPAEWRDAGDRVRFLDALDPEILTGDPMSFADLAALPVAIRPKAMISTAVLLLPATRERLEQRFGCPVIDLYSTCETGPIAVASPRGFEAFLPDVYLEILRPDGTVASLGERGEITFTGGRNPFLPLLRYRTGDWAALAFDGAAPVLVDFEGRRPVVLEATDGRLLNNIDVTIAFRPFALVQFTVHQNADGSLLVRTLPHPVAGMDAVLRGLFGADQKIVFEPLPDHGAKRVPYSSDRSAAKV